MSDDYGPTLPPGFGRRSGGGSTSSDEDTSQIGPTLPPHLRKRKHSSSSEEENNAIGPAMPPGFKQSINVSDHDSEKTLDSMTGTVRPVNLKQSRHSDDEEECVRSVGPILPPGFKNSSASDENDQVRSIGPALPPGFKKSSNSDEDDTERYIGPALPPGFQKSSNSDENCVRSIGPAMPPGFKRGNLYGPALPSDVHPPVDEIDEDVIGPLPSEMTKEGEAKSVAAEFAERSQRMKSKLTKKSDEDSAPKQRESWMTELPTGMRKDLGLTARTFSTRVMPEKDKDSSVWTDTPADKERKMREGEKKKHRHREESIPTSSRDKHSSKYMEKHSKSKRGDSLLEMHQKEMKKKKKKDKDKPKERRPFDRDLDLQVNKFDNAQRESIIRKSQQLNTRFKHGGSTSSFL